MYLTKFPPKSIVVFKPGLKKVECKWVEMADPGEIWSDNEITIIKLALICTLAYSSHRHTKHLQCNHVNKIRKKSTMDS